MRKKRNGIGERVTLANVAEIAGVSAITVSRALRNPEIVSQEVRERILKVVDEIGYVPDMAARSLASRDSGLITVLVPSMTSYIFSDVMRGIEARVGEDDFSLHYANSMLNQDEEARHLKHIAGLRPVGLLIANVPGEKDNSEHMRRLGCPVVQVQDISSEPFDMAIGVDHSKAAAVATRHLLDCGYKRIGVLGRFFGVRGERRHVAYRQEMENAGAYDADLIQATPAPFTVQSGSMLMTELLDRVGSVDAVICQSDELALGALFECQRRGIRVPEEMGICGFNDLEFASVSVPPLTTVRVPRFDVGYQAADMLLKAYYGRYSGPAKRELDCELMVRGSTAKIDRNS